MSPASPIATRAIRDEAARTFTRVEELSYELTIADVMTREVKCVSPDWRMRDLVELLRQARISGAPVLSGGRLVGVISVEDLVRAALAGDLDAAVGRYMSDRVMSVRARDAVVEALKTFARAGVGRLPVVDEAGRLVGILTKGDITGGLLRTLEHEFHAEEVHRYRASHLFEDIASDRTTLTLRYSVQPRDFVRGGEAAGSIKRALHRLGATPELARRCGIAAYAAEMNLVIHTTHGGVLEIDIEPHRIVMRAIDDGPGIEDVALALRPGWSSAPPDVQEMGFGAGMGLRNIRRCVDKMILTSTPGEGTRLEMEIHLDPAIGLREDESSDDASRRR